MKNPRQVWQAAAATCVAAMVAMAGCGSDDEPPTGPASGAGAASSSQVSSSSQGGAGECLLSTDCPGKDNDCGTRTCINNTCGLILEPPGAACDDDDGTVCDGSGECVECLDDTQCASEDYCGPQQTCIGKKGLVQPCTQDNECLSGACADDICCDSACSGVCEACVFDKSGGQNGTCAPVTAATDPDDECPGAQTCDGNGACSG